MKERVFIWYTFCKSVYCSWIIYISTWTDGYKGNVGIF